MAGSDDDELILRAIRVAVLCGSLELWSRLEPGAARGLRRLAVKYRADYQAMLKGVEGPGWNPAPAPRRPGPGTA